MNKFSQDFNSRDAQYYINQIPLGIREKLNEQEIDSIKSIIHTAVPRSTPKLIDLRFVADLIVARYFVVLMIGRDIRKQQRQYPVNGITKIANTLAAILLIIAMSLLISAVTILILYLIKSALGIDFFKGHINEVLFNRSK